MATVTGAAMGSESIVVFCYVFLTRLVFAIHLYCLLTLYTSDRIHNTYDQIYQVEIKEVSCFSHRVILYAERELARA